MWVLTTKGAVSIVKFNHAPEGDPRTMQVRSRRREWLEPFAELVGRDEKIKLIHSTDKDYSWRFFATPEEVALAMSRLALSIDYSNFKNATSDSRYGLRDAKLRNGLHDAYSKVWSTLLGAGDGDSLYDGKWKTSTGYGAGTIDICARLGHWWTQDGKGKCDDCGMDNPNYPEKGPVALKPTKRQVTAWWKAHGGRSNKAKLVAAHNAAKSAKYKASKAADTDMGGTSHTAKDSPGLYCTGSWLHAAKSSLDVSNGAATGECSVCGERQPLTLDTWVIRPHDKPVAALLPAEAIVDDEYVIPDPVPTIQELEAARDAAKSHYYDVEDAYDRGEADDEAVDDAINAYCDAEDALFTATGSYLPGAAKESA